MALLLKPGVRGFSEKERMVYSSGSQPCQTHCLLYHPQTKFIDNNNLPMHTIKKKTIWCCKFQGKNKKENILYTISISILNIGTQLNKMTGWSQMVALMCKTTINGDAANGD